MRGLRRGAAVGGRAMQQLGPWPAPEVAGHADAGTCALHRRLAAAAYGKVNGNGLVTGAYGPGARGRLRQYPDGSGRYSGTGSLAIGVVGRAHHGPGSDVAEAQRIAVLLQRLVLLRRPVA